MTGRVSSHDVAACQMEVGMLRGLLLMRRRAFTLTLACLLTVTGAWATTSGAAAASPTRVAPVAGRHVVVGGNGLHLTPAQAALANRTLGFISDKSLWGEFVVTHGTLATVDPVAIIQSKYGLSADQVKTVQGILTYANSREPSSTASKAGVVHPDLHLDGTVLYFTFSDMVAFLVTAAIAGPYALAAALNALGWLLGGPIGGVMAFILTVIGITTIANLAYLIVQAHVLHRGVYFGITWNPFPNYTQGLWCGCS